jgi:hypothetical protein
MKKSISGYSIFFLLGLTVLPSCRKSNAGTADSCIERAVLLPGDLPVNSPPVIVVDSITAGQIDTIKTLFANNNLPFDQYQFLFYNEVPWHPDSIQQQVTANPFLNGLPIFNDGQVFNFFNGIYSASSSYLTVEAAVNSDTTGHQSLSYLRSAFFQYLSEATITGGAADSKPVAPSPAAYKDTCLWATLGYIDQSYIPGNSFSLGHVIKIWQVTPANSNYPTIYVRDDNGQGWGVAIAFP